MLLILILCELSFGAAQNQGKVVPCKGRLSELKNLPEILEFMALAMGTLTQSRPWVEPNLTFLN